MPITIATSIGIATWYRSPTYAELSLTLANVFRKFEMELWEREREMDIDLEQGFFHPSWRLESKGGGGRCECGLWG